MAGRHSEQDETDKDLSEDDCDSDDCSAYINSLLDQYNYNNVSSEDESDEHDTSYIWEEDGIVYAHYQLATGTKLRLPIRNVFS